MIRPLLALLGAIALAAPALATTPPPAAATQALDPRDQVLYLTLVDRFANGDRANDHGADPHNPHAYHGGDLAGLKAKLPYLQDLGVTTLWLTPLNDNQDGPYLGKYWGYHGYWIQDFDRMDEHFGTEAELAALVADAHQRQMRVLLDVVVNHAGYDAPIAHDPARRDWFHHNGSITDWEDAYQCENYDLVGLPDFASEKQEVLAFMERAWGGWVTRAGLDGFRLDTVRHVPMAFWQHFLGAMHRLAAPRPFFTVGEVSFHDPHRVAPYLRGAGAGSGLDAAFDFPMFETLTRVFAHGESATLLANRLREDALYEDPSHLVPFLDSHDEVRFLTSAGNDERKLRLALACLFTLRGAPCLTYGTEQGLAGGKDPDNRRDMPWEHPNPALYGYTRSLIQLRKAHEALRRGGTRVLAATRSMVAYERVTPHERLVVVLNNQARPDTLALPTAGLRELGGRVLPFRGGVTLGPYGFAVLTRL